MPTYIYWCITLYNTGSDITTLVKLGGFYWYKNIFSMLCIQHHLQTLNEMFYNYSQCCLVMLSTWAVISAFIYPTICGLFLKTSSFRNLNRNNHRGSNPESTVTKTIWFYIVMNISYTLLYYKNIHLGN